MKMIISVNYNHQRFDIGANKRSKRKSAQGDARIM